MDNYRIVEDRLKNAFAEAIAGSKDAQSLTHDDLLVLRRDLPLFPAKTLQVYLPLVLIDLLHTHTNDASDNQGAESVMQYLSIGEYSERQSDQFLFGAHAAQDAADSLEFCNARKRRIFQAMTHEQAGAIVDWLEAVKEWNDFYYCRADQFAAEAYWKRGGRDPQIISRPG